MVTNGDPLIFVKEPLTHFPSRSGCLIGQLDKVRPGAVQRLPTRRTSPVGVRQRPVRPQAAAERPCGRKPSTERSEFRLRVLRAEAAGAGEGGPPPDAGAKAANPLSIGTGGGQWVRGRSQHLGCSGTRTRPAGCGTQAGAGAGGFGHCNAASIDRVLARVACLHTAHRGVWIVRQGCHQPSPLDDVRS